VRAEVRGARKYGHVAGGGGAAPTVGRGWYVHVGSGTTSGAMVHEIGDRKEILQGTRVCVELNKYGHTYSMQCIGQPEIFP
jgi:hypothetical protein